MEALLYTALAAILVFLLLRFGLGKLSQRMRGRPMPDVSLLTERDVAAMDCALFYFHQPTCAACRAMTPAVDELAASRGNVFQVDILAQPELAAEFHILSTPTTILVSRGVIRDIRMGALSPSLLQGLLRPVG